MEFPGKERVPVSSLFRSSLRGLLVAIAIGLVCGGAAAASGQKVLFDASHAQTAGNADWVIDGEKQDKSLFGMIRNTHEKSPRGTVVAYSDNSSIIEGYKVKRFYPGEGAK